MALVDQSVLAADVTFQNRVEEALLTAAIAIANEAQSTVNHVARSRFATQVLLTSITYKPLFAKSVATDATVATQAGSPATQALVLDAAISNAISAQWNSYLGVL